MAYKKPRAPKTSYVPKVVFTVVTAAVIPALAPSACGDSGPVGVACTSFCGVAAVAMGGFGGVAAVAMGGFGGVGGTGGSGGTTTGTGGGGGTAGGGGTTGAGGSGGTHFSVAQTGFIVPADPRAAPFTADPPRTARKTSRATRARRRG